MLRSFALLLVLAVPAVAPASAVAGSQTPAAEELAEALRLANAAHVRHDIDTEYRVLQDASELPADEALAAALQLRLAVLEWKYQLRVDHARERLRRATGGPSPSSAWLALARLEQAQEDWRAAERAAREALDGAGSVDLRRRAGLARLRAVVGGAMERRRNGAEPDRGALSRVVDELSSLVAIEPGQLEPSRLLLVAALLIDDGPAAVTGWRSYYHAFPGTPLPASIAEAGERLLGLLRELDPERLDPEYRRDLVDALAGTRFIEEAALVARDPRVRSLAEEPTLAPLLVYEEEIRRLREDVRAYYRRMVRDEHEPSALTARVLHTGRRVWTAVHGEPPGGELRAEALWRLLAERFGTAVRLALMSRRWDLVMGHVVEEQERVVEQYGRSVRVRFVAVDNMVSRGFQDWAWEHRQGAQGFASTSTITQVRPAYVPGALRAWRSVGDPWDRAVHESEIALESRRDESRATADPHAWLPGLGMRLEHQGRMRLLEALRGTGLVGQELRAAFLYRYQETLRQSSIFAHEGRHAMDLRDGAEYHREFAARLSEVAFAEHPRLAFSGIIDGNIGDGTFHGTANLMVMQGLVRWMDAHRDEIEGLDPARPLLPQLDLLADEQLRRACRDMDPAVVAKRSTAEPGKGASAR